MVLALACGSCSSRVDVAAEQAAIRALFERHRVAIEGKDVAGTLAMYDDSGPIAVFFGSEATLMTDRVTVERLIREWLSQTDRVVMTDSSVLVRIHPSGTSAWATYLTDETDSTKGTGTTEYLRATFGLEKHGQSWVVVQAHWSVPTGAQRQPLRRAPSN
jgi:ketosteroid isomerase-like protein